MFSTVTSKNLWVNSSPPSFNNNLSWLLHNRGKSTRLRYWWLYWDIFQKTIAAMVAGRASTVECFLIRLHISSIAYCSLLSMFLFWQILRMMIFSGCKGRLSTTFLRRVLSSLWVSIQCILSKEKCLIIRSYSKYIWCWKALTWTAYAAIFLLDRKALFFAIYGRTLLLSLFFFESIFPVFPGLFFFKWPLTLTPIFPLDLVPPVELLSSSSSLHSLELLSRLYPLTFKSTF